MLPPRPGLEHPAAGHPPPKAVGLVVHGGRTEAIRAAAHAAALLRSTGIDVVGSLADGWPEGTRDVELRQPAEFGQGLDVVIVFGGDGTFLRAAYLARDCGVPLLGVNLGRLGFLSEVEAGQVPHAVAEIVAGRFEVEERMTLTVAIHDADGALVGTSWALNEASVERTVPQRLIVLEVRVGEVIFAHVPADAVICATPTGSTAYAFSAGGPILSPRVDAILLVPVAPHSLFARTLVVDPREALSLRPVGGDNECVVTCDGRETLPVPPGGQVRVGRAGSPVRLARLGPFDFYERVRDKFGLR
ncbi:NAD kinase [soil metagenome]|nr:NAD(+)/NADH kinase [Euzebyaceae bacterium]